MKKGTCLLWILRTEDPGAVKKGLEKQLSNFSKDHLANNALPPPEKTKYEDINFTQDTGIFSNQRKLSPKGRNRGGNEPIDLEK